MISPPNCFSCPSTGIHLPLLISVMNSLGQATAISFLDYSKRLFIVTLPEYYTPLTLAFTLQPQEWFTNAKHVTFECLTVVWRRGNLSNLLLLNLLALFSTAFHQKCVVLRMPNSACHAMPLHPLNLCCGYSLYQECTAPSLRPGALIHEPSEPADFLNPYLEQVPILCDSIIPCSYLLFIKGWIIVKL